MVERREQSLSINSVRSCHGLNTSNKPLYGPGEKFESDMAFDQFWKDHGFADHFEIKARDWNSGENSVFGQAVNCLIEKILTERT